jgi:ABC-type nitrate/sulfonate/bicarbonate transport system substrate-binding protein
MSASMSRHGRLLDVAGILILLLMGVACQSNAKPRALGPGRESATSAPKPAHLTYVFTSVAWNIAAEEVAQAKGFFAEQNLTVDLPVAGQSASACQQVLAKAADLAQCSLNDMIQADEAGGAHLILLMNENTTALQYGVIAKPSINSWADLKGKTVIVGGPKDNTLYYFHVMARANGLKDSDYNFQYAGATSARAAALKAGAVDVAMLANPVDNQLEQEGYHRLGNLLPTYLNADNYAGGGPVASRDWANAHRDEVTRYLAAISKSIAWINNPANKQELFAILGPKLNLTQDVFDQTYQTTVVDSKTWSNDGHVSDSAIEGVLKGLVDLGALKEPVPPASKYYDTSYLTAAHGLLGR